MKYYGSSLTRDEYLAVSYLGRAGPDDNIPVDVEETFPEQFRRVTLETPAVSKEVH
jgi:hypothetical protein